MFSNQQLFEKLLCNKSNYFENMDDFHYIRKPSYADQKIDTVSFNNEESMKNVLYALCYAKKSTSQAEVMLNSEKIKLVA